MSAPDDADVLRESLRVRALSPEALQRIRRAAEAEWRRNSARRRRMPLALAAAFAGLVVLAGATWFVWRPPQAGAAPQVVAQLARSFAPGTIELRRWQADLPVGIGAQIHSGQTIAAQGAALFSLTAGGNMRVARGSQFVITAANTVQLERGEIYVDIPPGSRGSVGFITRTPAGEFHHLGTQFAIAVIDGATRLRVREGSVRWRAERGDSTVPAGTEMLIDEDLHVTQQPVDVAGSEWMWTQALTPDIDIENQPLSGFLEWVARETGRRLVFANEATRAEVARIRTHGSIRGLEPLQALAAVMATTSMRFELADGVIRVSYVEEPPHPVRTHI